MLLLLLLPARFKGLLSFYIVDWMAMCLSFLFFSYFLGVEEGGEELCSYALCNLYLVFVRRCIYSFSGERFGVHS